MAINIIAIILSGIMYVVLTTLLHRRHRRKILDEFSYTEKINLDWIQYLIWGIALIWLFVILDNDDMVFGSAVFFVLFIGYFGIKQVGIFTRKPPGISDPPLSSPPLPGETVSTENVPDPPDETLDMQSRDDSPVIEARFDAIISNKKKYSKSGLSPESAAALHQKLGQLVQSEKVYCRSELTLTELAKMLGTHPNYLSQVINEKEGKNFYDYINTLRTEEFKKLVADPHNQRFTLLSLAFECGFNSKSSFNKYFKKVTGQSPSEYVQQLKTVEAA